MAFCRNCGVEIDDRAVMCPKCGVMQDSRWNTPAVNPEDDKHAGWWGVLGFFVPIVGLILFLVWRDTRPKCAKSAGIGALISTVLSIVLAIIAMIFSFGMFSIALGEMGAY